MISFPAHSSYHLINVLFVGCWIERSCGELQPGYSTPNFCRVITYSDILTCFQAISSNSLHQYQLRLWRDTAHIISRLQYINFLLCYYMYYEHSLEVPHQGAQRVANEVSSTVGNMTKAKYHTTIYTFSRKLLWPIFFLFSSRKLSPGRQDWGGLDYTTSHTIWVSLISVKKWQGTSFNKCHEHILLIIFIIYYWFTYIFIY